MIAQRKCTCDNNFKFNLVKEFTTGDRDGFTYHLTSEKSAAGVEASRTAYQGCKTATYNLTNFNTRMESNLSTVVKPVPLYPSTPSHSPISDVLIDEDNTFVHLQLASSEMNGAKWDAAAHHGEEQQFEHFQGSSREIRVALSSATEGGKDVSLSQPQQHCHAGFLDAGRLMSALVAAGEGRLFEGDVVSRDALPLCGSCVERVARAIQADVERLSWECEMYDKTIGLEEDKQRREILEEAVNGQVGYENASLESMKDSRSSMRAEMEVLTMECDELEKQVRELNVALEEERYRAMALNIEEDNYFLSLNCLEIDSKNYQAINYDLANSVVKTQKEIDALSLVKLDSVLFDIRANKYDTIYPMINGLRMAYCPKHDLKWNEINAAWSQALQLLLFVGGMVDFTWREFRIVPIMTCAKIIHMDLPNKRKIIHHLGKELEQKQSKTNISDDMALSLRAFHSLLRQLSSFVQDCYFQACKNIGKKPPFQTSIPNEMDLFRIGRFDLRRLQSRDYASWQSLIFYMAENLKWLAELTSALHSIELHGGSV